MNKEEFIIECKKIGIDINEEIYKKLDLYKNLLIEWNKKINLTTIIEENDILLKHFYDSIYLTTIMDLSNKEICDFGTGAGFPGMVLAIIIQSSNFTLIESNNKKIKFLEEVKKVLDLNNVSIVTDRVELYGKNNREIFDIVTCRAVSSLGIILELSASILKKEGYFLPMKSNVDEELSNSKNIEKDLGYNLITIKRYLLPKENSNRTILIYKKTKETPSRYPRNYGTIKKNNVK